MKEAIMFREKSESPMQVTSSYSEPMETSLWVDVISPLSVPTVDFSENSLTAVCKKNISNTLENDKKELILYRQLEKKINEEKYCISYNKIKKLFK